MTNPEWLKDAAQRSGQDPATLGHVFEQYRKQEGQSVEALAAMLGCSLETFHWLSLCRRPEQERFAEHLRMIEQRFAVDARRLAVVLRRVEVLGARPADQEGGPAVRKGPNLIAARDHSKDGKTDS